MSDLQTIRELSAYQLAGMADCATPDTPTSEGATFLTRVRDATLEAIEYAHDDGDTWVSTLQSVRDGDALHEIADGAPSVYTHQRWQEFVDLAAYNEDASELGASTSDLTGAAGVALYMIAERLAVAIVEELEDWASELDSADDDEDTNEEEWAYDSAHGTSAEMDARVRELVAADPHREIKWGRSDDSGLWEVHVRTT